MVSLAGAQQATPLIAQIATLTTSIATVKAALAASPTIWKMDAAVYVQPPGDPAPPKVSTSMTLQYNLSVADTTAILNAVLTGLQNELAVLNAQLAAIS